MTAERAFAVEILCRDCGLVFGVTAEEDAYLERGGRPLPGRCRPCRLVARYQREGREFTDTFCTRCGARAVVPFKPSAGRDVLCDACLAEDRARQRGGTR
jgi:CxxC-x17-CxxC domain-containing protein